MEKSVSDTGQANNRPVVVAMVKKTHYLGLVAVVIGCLVGIGFYRGWFALSTQTETATHKVDINLTVDPDRVERDAKRAAELTKAEAAELSAKLKKEAKQLREQSK
jgi:hypothetical protein